MADGTWGNLQNLFGFASCSAIDFDFSILLSLVTLVCLKAIYLTKAVDKMDWLGPTLCSWAVDTDV